MPSPLPSPEPGDLPGDRPAPVLLRDGTRTYAVHTLTAALACCAVEAQAAHVRAELAAEGAPAKGAGAAYPQEQDSPTHVLVVAGTVTHAMAPAVQRLWESLPQPRRAIAFGACATSGGPYWDSYSVANGIGDRVPVDLFVPGCPPRPEVLLSALRRREVGS